MTADLAETAEMVVMEETAEMPAVELLLQILLLLIARTMRKFHLPKGKTVKSAMGEMAVPLA